MKYSTTPLAIPVRLFRLAAVCPSTRTRSYFTPFLTTILGQAAAPVFVLVSFAGNPLSLLLFVSVVSRRCVASYAVFNIRLHTFLAQQDPELLF